MSRSDITIGIDNRNGLFYAARVSHETGRPQIKGLLRFEKDKPADHQLLDNGKIITAVSDDLVMLKNLNIPKDTPDFDLKACFEMSSTVLEDENNFLYDTAETYLENRTLGMMIRTETITEVLSLFDKKENSPPEGMIRSLGLAKGYLNFCKLSEGELVCLADFNHHLVSLAFLYQNRLLDLSYMSLKSGNFNNSENLEKTVIELKTTVNYRTASFFDLGITVPLSTIIVNGDGVDDKMLEMINRYFNLKAKLPEINRGFISNQSEFESIPLQLYLVALGLNVK